MAQAEFGRGLQEEAIRLCDRSLQMYPMDQVREFREKVVNARDGVKQMRDATREDLESTRIIFVNGKKASIDRVDFPLVYYTYENTAQGETYNMRLTHRDFNHTPPGMIQVEVDGPTLTGDGQLKTVNALKMMNTDKISAGEMGLNEY